MALVQVMDDPGLTFLGCSGGGLLLARSRCCSANRHHTRFTCMRRNSTHLNAGKHFFEARYSVVCSWLKKMARLTNPLHSSQPSIVKQNEMCTCTPLNTEHLQVGAPPLCSVAFSNLVHFRTSQFFFVISPFCPLV